MDNSIFRAYDIRGVYPEELNEETAFKIGWATAKFLKAQAMIVGEDARLSSPSLRSKVVEGIMSAGCDVVYIGQCTTPLFYFSVIESGVDGGIMVTASHNPAKYNGLKIVRGEAVGIGLNSGLEDIKKIAEGEVEPAGQTGTFTEKTWSGDYTESVIRRAKVGDDDLREFKIVADSSNGMASLTLKPLLEKFKIESTLLYSEIDCTFPNHSPDTSREENLEDLKNKVLEIGADVGFAFDGDADRVAVVDNEGQIVRADYLTALFYKYGWENPKVIYDLRFSKSVKELIGSDGVPSRPGHTLVKETIRKNNGDLGAELAGHFFFKEMGYVESGNFTMLKVLKIMKDSGKTLAELVRTFKRYFNSGEINITISNAEQGLDILGRLKEEYKDGKIDELDGVTIDFWDLDGWWFNIRPSNTEPLLRLVVEAKTKNLLDEKVSELTMLIGD